MTAEMIKQIVPLGIIGLAIVAVLLIAVNPGSRTNLWLAAAAMAVIGVLGVFDKLTPTPTLKEAPTKPPMAPVVPGGSAGDMFWVDTGTNADWGGRDVAYTSGLVPKYAVKDSKLCDQDHAGSIATCWDNRTTGYPSGVNATDVTGAPPQWCTYKDSAVRLSTPPDGRATPGRVYLCARSIRP